jgi:TRAP transporter 4TM/12TM fusion protein
LQTLSALDTGRYAPVEEKQEKVSVKILNWSVLAVGVGMALYHLVSSQYLIVGGFKHQNVHLGLSFLLVFLLALRDSTSKGKPLAAVAAILSMSCVIYVGVFFDVLELRAMFNTKMDLIIGAMLIVLVLEATRRSFGLVLPVISCIAILYCFLGFLVPEPFRAMQVSPVKVIPALSIGFRGIYGSILAISANYIFLFVFFGTVLQISGATRFFMEVGKLASRRFRAGPAMSSVVTSALVGSTTGSIGANIATTGSFTIPLMKKVGYKSEQAAAIEAAASSGGQIMPPIMGAAAFAMAGITGKPYLYIALIALLPAILYFTTLGLYAQFQAGKLNLPHISEPIDFREMWLRAPLFIVPISIVVFFLMQGRTLMYAAFWAIVSSIFLSFLRKKTRSSLKVWAKGFCDGAIAGAQIGISCACIGMVVETLMLTGMGVRLPGLVETWSGGNINIALLIIMVISIILGMGVTTLAVYVLVAMVTAPVLIKMGMPMLSAHFFVFYFACFSMITPPIGMGSVIASKVAGADYLKTAIESVKAAIAGFIVPFLIIWNPILLLNSDREMPIAVLRLIASISLLVTLESLLVNYYLTNFKIWERMLFGFSVVITTIAFIADCVPLLFIGITFFLFVTISQAMTLRAVRKSRLVT